jgi:hypothetical protein
MPPMPIGIATRTISNIRATATSTFITNSLPVAERQNCSCGDCYRCSVKRRRQSSGDGLGLWVGRCALESGASTLRVRRPERRPFPPPFHTEIRSDQETAPSIRRGDLLHPVGIIACGYVAMRVGDLLCKNRYFDPFREWLRGSDKPDIQRDRQASVCLIFTNKVSGALLLNGSQWLSTSREPLSLRDDFGDSMTVSEALIVVPGS